MEDMIKRLYQFLLADPARDVEYSEGNEVGGYKVYGTALEMKDRFSEAFEKQPISSAFALFSKASVWHIDNCTIIYESKADNQIPNEPHCFGYLSVIGSRPDIYRVNKKLTSTFPGIDDLVNEFKY